MKAVKVIILYIQLHMCMPEVGGWGVRSVSLFAYVRIGSENVDAWDIVTVLFFLGFTFIPMFMDIPMNKRKMLKAKLRS
jgi:hypothetical protein